MFKVLFSIIVLNLCQVFLFSQTFINLNEINDLLKEKKISNALVLPQKITVDKDIWNVDSVKITVLYSLDILNNQTEIKIIPRIQCFNNRTEKVFNLEFPREIRKVLKKLKIYIQHPIIIFLEDSIIKKNKYYAGLHTFYFI